MQKLTKTYPAPAILTGPKASEEINSLQSKADNGEADLSFNSTIYADKTVKDQLKADQNNKCAFCERLRNGDFGDVEHYRPKGAYTDSKGQAHAPAYYWLAYEWNNLMLSCSECNRTHKKTAFPLLDESARDIAGRDISNEQPLLINPYIDNPAEHLTFARHIVKPTVHQANEDPKGRCTIETLGLNSRKDLVEQRRNRWEEYNEIINIIEFIQEKPFEGSEEILQRLISIKSRMEAPESEFSGMFTNQESK